MNLLPLSPIHLRLPAAVALVNPNNPDGRLWSPADTDARLSVIDESFCDIAPERSLMASALDGDRVILKSFGKFWGLAGLRLHHATALFDRTLAPVAVSNSRPVVLAAAPTAIDTPTPGASIDAATRRNLELTHGLSGGRDGSLSEAHVVCP